MSRGRKLKTNSSPLVLGGGSSSAAAGSGWVKVAPETRSPKFDFINSVIFVFSSSGEGNGGGGFCSILANRKKVARKSIMATVRLNLTPEFAIRSSRADCNSRLNPELHQQKSTVFFNTDIDRTRNSAACV